MVMEENAKLRKSLKKQNEGKCYKKKNLCFANVSCHSPASKGGKTTLVFQNAAVNRNIH